MTNKLNTALVYFTTLVLLSSLVVTPVSISSSYWGYAFAEEFTTEIEQIQSLNVTSTESITTEEPVVEETTTETTTEATTEAPVVEETETESKTADKDAQDT